MRLRKKKQETERPLVEVKENLYGHGRHTGKDIDMLIQEYGRVLPARVIKSNYGYTYGIKHISGFNLTAYYGHEVIYITGAYRATEGLVELKDYQVDNLIDKLYPMMAKEIAGENLRISQKIDNIGRTHENQGIM